MDVCGGCAEDADDDGICDDVDECIEASPRLGVCGGNCAEDADDGICTTWIRMDATGAADSIKTNCDDEMAVALSERELQSCASLMTAPALKMRSDLNGDWQINRLTFDFLLLYGTDCEETCAGDLNETANQLTDLLTSCCCMEPIALVVCIHCLND